MTLALLFPGQGVQRPGMTAALRDSDPELLRGHLEHAAAASKLPIAQLCEDGPGPALSRTEAAQPALLAVSLTLADIARDVGLRAVAVGGHSLGECTAAVTAGALAVEDGVALVAERGRLMAREQARRPGAMAVVLGISGAEAAALCRRAAGDETLVPANFNAMRQTVVSGDVPAVERLLALVREDGAGRGVRLPVGGAFHSPLMRPVQHRLQRIAAALPWSDPRTPLAANAAGALVHTGDDVRDALVAQVAAPVHWVACVRALLDAGCRHFLELGPGQVLTGLVRQIAPGVDAAAAGSRDAIEAFAAARPHLLSA